MGSETLNQRKENMPAWVNFKELRGALSFEQVLVSYKVEVKKKGVQHTGFCPLPKHGGKKNSPSFSANLERGIFQCFGCGAKGNLLDFACLMEGLDPEKGEDMRTVAVKLQKDFGLEKPQREKKQPEPEPELLPREPTEGAKPVKMNEPLDFELKRLDGEHPYLAGRGFTKATVTHFGLGYCGKGMLVGRIAIPIHSTDGKLLGYGGRVVDDATITPENPRYKFPPKREREGVIYEFHKSLVIYNAHRIKKPAPDLIVVEGFPSVWWLTQLGFPDTVALMGWSCSDEQAEIINSLLSETGRVWLISDGDEAGEKCAAQVLPRVGSNRFIRWLRLPTDKQPTDFPEAFFRERIA